MMQRSVFDCPVQSTSLLGHGSMAFWAKEEGEVKAEKKAMERDKRRFV